MPGRDQAFRSEEGPDRAFRRRGDRLRRRACSRCTATRVRLPDGSQATREYIRHPGRGGDRRRCSTTAASCSSASSATRTRRDFIEIPAGKLEPGEAAPRHREARAAGGDRLRRRRVDAPGRDPHRHRLHRRGDRALRRAQADHGRAASSTRASSSRPSSCRSPRRSPWCATAASPTRRPSPRCSGSRRFYDRTSPQRRARPRQPRLARLVPQLLLRRLPRPAAHGLRPAARDQRGPRAGRQGLRHARPPRHGDHQLRARGRARPQGLDGQRLDHRAGRRAAHERRQRRAPQRVQPREAGRHALPADLDRAQRRGHRAVLRAEAFPAGGQARPPAPDRLARRTRRVGHHPPGRAALRRSVRRPRERRYQLQNEKGYVHVARGRIAVNGQALEAGDALKTGTAASS